MNIYEKLQKCRVELQKADLKKSGWNDYSKYDYFELCDFLPKINELFNENKMCSFVSFTAEIATLTIVDSENPTDTIVFTSPMSTAKLTACHEVQNLGAVESYERRYLYMTALEIVEVDVLDKTHDKNQQKQGGQNKPNDPNSNGVSKHICSDCGKEIKATQKKTVDEIIEGSMKYYKVKLCQSCVSKRYKATHPEK